VKDRCRWQLPHEKVSPGRTIDAGQMKVLKTVFVLEEAFRKLQLVSRNAQPPRSPNQTVGSNTQVW
jgi:hypothetical protein